MRTKLTAIAALAALAALAVTLTAVASAGSTTAKQRVAIQDKGDGSFVLTPLTSGAVKPDTGTVTFCCWRQRTIMRHGESIDINNPRMTLTGKLGSWPATGSDGSMSRTVCPSLPAPGKSSVAPGPTPD